MMKPASDIQRQPIEEEEEMLQMSASPIHSEEKGHVPKIPLTASNTIPLVQYRNVTDVVQRSVLDKIAGILGLKKRPEDVAIEKAEKKANRLVKKYEKMLKKLQRMNDQYVSALEKGKDTKAEAIYAKLERFIEELDKVRDETEEAQNDLNQKLFQKQDQISELISQPLVKPTEEEIGEAESELNELIKQNEEQESIVSSEEEEYNRILDSIEITKEELEAYKAERKAKEDEKYSQQLGEVKIPTSKLPEAKSGVTEEEKVPVQAKSSQAQRQPIEEEEEELMMKADKNRRQQDSRYSDNR